jgi:hypothetical protein
MKSSEIKIGTRILLPCPRCERKRSLTFHSVNLLKAQRERICVACRNNDTAESVVAPYHSPSYRKSHTPDMRELPS